MSKSTEIKLNITTPIRCTIIDPKYKLYNGELSERHPINLYHDGTDIVIDEYQDNNTAKEISRIKDENINTDLLPSLFLIYTRPYAADDILRDILDYVKLSILNRERHLTIAFLKQL